MPITVTTCKTNEELREALTPILHYFGGVPLTDEDIDRWGRTLGPERMHVAREEGVVVGGAGAFPFEVTVPGGLVPASGVTVVGVPPTHRRRGILTSMMRAQLDDAHRRGDPIAVLFASEETIYGRFGYGIASLSGDIELPKAATAFARPFSTNHRTRIVSAEEALEPFSQVHDRVRRDVPGMFARTRDWWKLRRLADPENRRQGGGVLNRVLLTLNGKPEGYALYRMHQSMEGGISTGFLNVIEAVGASPEATAAIWRFLLDVDWISRIKASLLPVDHPLLFLLARPRAMRFRIGDALWVRLVDVQAALAARSYGAADPVVIEVSDSFCPWNAGRYQVAAGAVRRSEDAADLVMDAEALGSAYLGAFAVSQLVQAGRAQELRKGAAARADVLFGCDRRPWCPEIF